MIIDAHTHGMHGGYLDRIEALGGEWIDKAMARLRQQARQTPQYLDVALRVRQLDERGYDRHVVTLGTILDPNLFPSDPASQLALAGLVNDNMARLMEDSKGKLVAIGCVPLASMNQGGRQEMKRAIESLGLKGINLPSNIYGKPLDSPDFEPFWDMAEELDIAVYTHPVFQASRGYEADFDLPHVLGWPYETAIMLSRLVFSGVMERHPALKVVSHHLGGGMIPFFMGRIDESNDTTNPRELKGPPMPRPLYDYYSRFYYDSAVGGSAAAIKCACDVFGVDQIVFATDSPHGPGAGLARMESYPKVVASLGLSPADTEKIMSGNVRRLLKLD